MKKNRNKKRVLILSDLWGWEKADWLGHYKTRLAPNFEIMVYDSTILGAVSMMDGIQQNIHQKFVEGGIDRAVDYLLINEKERVDVLAFSVGGVIAWKAAMKGLKVDKLLAVSSTRLRYETEKPSCDLRLYFGAKDPFLPNSEWFEKMQVSYEALTNEGHDVYKQLEMIPMFLQFFVE